MAVSAKPYRLPIPGALRGTAATNTKTRGGVPTKYRVMSYRTLSVPYIVGSRQTLFELHTPRRFPSV